MILSRFDEKLHPIRPWPQMKTIESALSGLDEIFKILTLILDVEDDEPGSTRLTCLVLVIALSGHR